MKETGFTEQQIAFILRQADEGASVDETCRKAGIPLETYQRWRHKYSGLTPTEISRLKLLETENTRLRQLVAQLIVEKPTTQPGHQALPAEEGDTYPQDLPNDSDAISVTASASTALALLNQSATDALVGPDGIVSRARAYAHEFGERLRRLEPRLAAARAAATRTLQHPGQQSAALARAAAQWSRQQWEQLTWARVREQALRAGHLARARSRGREVLIAGVVGGLIAGFAYGLSSTPAGEGRQTAIEVDRNVRLNSSGGVASLLDKGWDHPQPWGTWMSGERASILLGFDGPARGDIDLYVEARVQPVPGAEPPIVVVRFNGAELGRWHLPAEARDLRRRFIVPMAVFNRSTAARLAFEIPDRPAQTVFGVQELTLREARHLRNYKGFVDTCKGDRLVGWAIAENAAASVAITVDGKPLKAVLSNLERPDLGLAGFPTDAGFELKPEEPIKAGTKVDVRFANGQPLVGSPCQP